MFTIRYVDKWTITSWKKEPFKLFAYSDVFNAHYILNHEGVMIWGRWFALEDHTLGIKPATPGHLFVPPGSPFYAPGSPFHAPGLLSCDHGVSFCALGSTFCTPTKIISTSYHQPTLFLKCSKITKFDYDNEFDESGIVCLEGI
jgi:hypothetical protein